MLGTFMAVMDVTVVTSACRPLCRYFTSPFDRRMGHYGYMITMTLMLPSAGWIADRIGNKRMYILGLVLFTFGSCSAAAPGAICS